MKPSGKRCGAPPLKDGSLCFWHTPAKADEVAEAQRLGGLRRKREKTVATAYEVDGLRDVDQIAAGVGDRPAGHPESGERRTP